MDRQVKPALLVIDDDMALRVAITEALCDAGYAAYEAGDGAEGLRVYLERRPQIVITDIFMPKQEGMETVHALRAADPGVKIIVMSGGTARRGRYDFLQVAESVGADRCLRKPFKAAELVKLVRELGRNDSCMR